MKKNTNWPYKDLDVVNYELTEHETNVIGKNLSLSKSEYHNIEMGNKTFSHLFYNCLKKYVVFIAPDVVKQMSYNHSEYLRNGFGRKQINEIKQRDVNMLINNFVKIAPLTHPNANRFIKYDEDIIIKSHIDDMTYLLDLVKAYALYEENIVLNYKYSNTSGKF